ncbi:histidine kinase dimerization/phospho-acceptor domain-containing protein, partial [Bradyrhizobium sp. 44]|uniref:histidine kinase dimerization/phospho-acceptor domain-containing protein n=1 Tax=Bradyrhizobium sp. 44 TaxID=2782675 RepID=UPI003211DCD2
MLGHDLRNPLASIAAGARLMLKVKMPEEALRLEAMMQSSVSRMAKMIESVMDLARGRLGGGISLSKAITAVEP